MGTYAYSGNRNKQRVNHANEYLPDLLNDIQNEIEIVEQVLSGGEEGQVLAADSNGKAKWSAPVGGSGGGGVFASFSYEPGENENWEDLFVLYSAAAEALHLDLNEQGENVSVKIMLHLAESPYHTFVIVRAFINSAWHSHLEASYDGSINPSYNPPSGTYNILSVNMTVINSVQ